MSRSSYMILVLNNGEQHAAIREVSSSAESINQQEQYEHQYGRWQALSIAACVVLGEMAVLVDGW
jgi:hypothetical protein